LPLVDANAHLHSLEPGNFSEVIVGAGAAGLLLASRLAAKGRRPLLLESGHFEPDDQRQRLNEIEEIGKPFGNAPWTRKRALGGTTTAWGGQSQRFDPDEFALHPWINESGWPVSFADLTVHYDVANSFMGVDRLNYGSDVFDLFGFQPPSFDQSKISFECTKWAPTPNLFKKNRRSVEQSVTVLFNCQLLRINLDESQRVHEIEIGNFCEDRRTIPVRTLALTPGGLETSRILLLNNHQLPSGLGNHSDRLGRAFMEHPCMRVGLTSPADSKNLQRYFATRIKGDRRYSFKVSASKEWRERNELLGVTAGFLWLYSGDDVGPLARLRRFRNRPRLHELQGLLHDASRLAPSLRALATEGRVVKPGATGVLAMSIEQEPENDCRIDLGTEVDCFGQRKARLRWSIGRKSWDTAVKFTKDFKIELARLGLGTLEIYEHVRHEQENWQSYLSDVNHHLGGARMSENPSLGVVDRNLQVWGISNLYVCSAAVFPTGYHSNPTLTVMALASRLADHLASRPTAV
jgi:choline dehydrogenase-like flavoprotein